MVTSIIILTKVSNYSEHMMCCFDGTCDVHVLVLLQVRIIPIQLQRLLANLLLLDQQSASVDALTSSFGWSNNEVGVNN